MLYHYARTHTPSTRLHSYIKDGRRLAIALRNTSVDMAEKDTKVSVSSEGYRDAFDSFEYLEQYYRKTTYLDRLRHTLRCYHAAFQTLPSGLKVLDYGSGPVVMNVISAATKASEIVLADYVGKNRKTLQKWLDEDSDAFDWSPEFEFVVRELEKKSEKEVKERQELVRKLAKAVVHCDITQDPPIESGYDQLYDVVVSCLVMEGTARSHDEYVSNASRLGKLVKPGGTIMIYGVENKIGFYMIGGHKFPNVHATAEFAVSAFQEAGFVDITVEKYSPTDDPNRIYRFIKGTKC